MGTGSVLWALIRATWGEQRSRPFVVVLCLIFCVVEISAVSYTHDLNDPTLFLTVMFGAGSIGRDVTTGVLPLLFTRPIKRGTYVFAKWIAVSSAAAVTGALVLTIQALLLRHRGLGLPGATIAAAVFASAASACGISSVLVFLSALVSGFGDIALWMGLRLLGALLAKRVGPRFVQEWRSLIEPSLAWDTLSGSHLGAWFRLVSYLSTVTLFLCLAVMAANRKEVSYAAG
jgi:hypothetical protein